MVSDSTYVVNCFRDNVVEARWLARGWKNSQKQPVANRDLWEPLVEEVLAHGGVTFRWVKGHSGDPMRTISSTQLARRSRRAVRSTHRRPLRPSPSRQLPPPPSPRADDPLTLF